MRRVYRITFVVLGSMSLILTLALWLQLLPVTPIMPWASTFLTQNFLVSTTAAITASLLWIGFSGELGTAVGGSIDLAVFYGGFTIFQLLAPGNGGQSLLAVVLPCLIGVIVSLGIFLRFRRYPIEDTRPLPLPVRISFALFVIVLVLVGSALLLHVPNVFAWSLNPMCAAFVGCFFLGSACYFLYGLLVPSWSNARGPLWSFLAYDLVLIVPFFRHFAAISSAQLPSLIVNTIILVYSAALAIYYLLIKQETRSLLRIESLPSLAKPPAWRSKLPSRSDHVRVNHHKLINNA